MMLYCGTFNGRLQKCRTFILTFAVARRETLYQTVETQSHKETTSTTSKESTKRIAGAHRLSAEIVFRSNEDFTIQISIPYVDSMLKSEERVQKQLNEVSVKATHEVLARFDRNGSPIQYGLPMAA